MPIDREITCILKPNPQDPHERIQRVGGPGFNYSLAAAVASVKSGENQFFVRSGGLLGVGRVEVYVNEPTGRIPWLQTGANQLWTDNLLSLPQFGISLAAMFDGDYR